MCENSNFFHKTLLLKTHLFCVEYKIGSVSLLLFRELFVQLFCLNWISTMLILHCLW